MPRDPIKQAATFKAWYERNKEKKKEQRRLWYADKANKQHAREYELFVNYGITFEQYEQMLAEQNGCCKLCGRTPQEERRALCVDHDHKTDRIRGLLCRQCNFRVIGGVERIGLEKVIAYLNDAEPRLVSQYAIYQNKREPAS